MSISCPVNSSSVFVSSYSSYTPIIKPKKKDNTTTIIIACVVGGAGLAIIATLLIAGFLLVRQYSINSFSHLLGRRRRSKQFGGEFTGAELSPMAVLDDNLGIEGAK